MENDAETTSSFGTKDIGCCGGFSFLWNNITGPGMVSLIIIYHYAGYVNATLLIVIFGLISGLAASFLCEAMASIKGNDKFQSRVEMMSIARLSLPRYAYYCTLMIFIFNLLIQNISAIVESAQTTDATIVAIFGKSCGAEIYPNQTFTCVGGGGNFINTTAVIIADSIFGDAWILSVGFILVALLAIPLGYWNLDDIIGVQIGAGILLFGIIIAWMYEFGSRGLKYEVHAFGSHPANEVGTTVFNYAYIVTVPSWINEKSPGISIHKSIWSALLPAIVTFTLLGWIGALAIRTTSTTDLLASLSTPETSTIAQIATYLFPWAALVSGIPIYSIIIRYNLIENNICTKTWANFWSVIFPWISAFCLMSGNLLNNLMNWGSILTTIPLNLMLPAFLYIVAKQRIKDRQQNMSMVEAAAGDGGTRTRNINDDETMYVHLGDREDENETQEKNDDYKAIPCFSEKCTVLLAWFIIIACGLGNIFVIAWQFIKI